MRSNYLVAKARMPRPRLVTIAVLIMSVGLVISSNLEAKKPQPGSDDPHWVRLVDNFGFYEDPTLTSKGLTIFNGPFTGGHLEADLNDFDSFTFAGSGIPLNNCMWTIRKRGGVVQGVTFFFTTGGNGMHRTDELSVEGVNGTTIEVHKDGVAVWKEKGRGKGTVAGFISVDDIVYEPVD